MDGEAERLERRRIFQGRVVDLSVDAFDMVAGIVETHGQGPLVDRLAHQRHLQRRREDLREDRLFQKPSRRIRSGQAAGLRQVPKGRSR